MVKIHETQNPKMIISNTDLNSFIGEQIALIVPYFGSVSISHAGILESAPPYGFQLRSNTGDYAILFSAFDVRSIQNPPCCGVTYSIVINIKSPDEYGIHSQSTADMITYESVAECNKLHGYVVKPHGETCPNCGKDQWRTRWGVNAEYRSEYNPGEFIQYTCVCGFVGPELPS